MATDNRTDRLFPDVTEHYGTELHVSTDLDFPVPQENYDEPDDGAFDDVILPIVQVEPIPTAAQVVDDHFTSDNDPTDELSTILPVYVSDYADDTVATEAAYDEPEPSVEFDDLAEDPDPLAHAPDWVRAHIPRHPLVMDDQSGKRRSPRLPRRSGKSGEAAADVAPTEPVATSKVREPKVPKVRVSSGERSPWVMRGAAAAVAAVVIGTAAAVLGSAADNGETSSATPAAVTTVRTSALSAAEPVWCESSSTGGKTIGRGAGDTTTGIGLIQAFDYAYYVLRDGAKVASMMLTPNPVATIQASINDAAAIGTEHCLTIAATANPNVFDVGLLLRTGSDSEGSVPQRITLANSGSGSGLKIATIEEIR